MNQTQHQTQHQTLGQILNNATDQSLVTERIKMGTIHMPPYPIMWCSCAMSPVIEAQQFESLKQFQIRDNEVLRKIKKLLKPIARSDYDIEYFRVKQKVFKEIQAVSLSFHTWYFSKISAGVLDMTDAEFQGNLIIGGVSVNGFISEPTEKAFGTRIHNKLVLNGLGKRAVNMRRQLKSPKNECAFTIVSDKLVDIELVTIAYEPNIKKAVVTLHVLHLY